MKVSIISFLVLFLLALPGCTKAKSKKWLIADITVIDAYTGEGIKSSLRLKWTHAGYLGSYGESSELGQTDDNGNMTFERSISKKDLGFTIEVNANGLWYGIPPFDMTNKIVKLGTTSKNEIIVTLGQVYPYSIKLKNTSCTGPLDSVWVEMLGPQRLYTGCVDTVLIALYGATSFNFDQNFTLKYTVKKSGVTNTFSENYALTPGVIHPIEINY